jgi:hypothetical protein
MNEEQARAFFIASIAAHARTLPASDAVNFLYGALLVCGERDELDPLYKAYTQLRDSDAQLELIASNQLRLPLDGNHK